MTFILYRPHFLVHNAVSAHLSNQQRLVLGTSQVERERHREGAEELVEHVHLWDGRRGVRGSALWGVLD